MRDNQPFANGRDGSGRFTAGNDVAKGRSRPFSARVNQWRKSLADSVTPEDFAEVARKLVTEAKAGERWAVEALLRYCIGDPQRAEFDERLAELEEQIGGGRR